MAFEPTSYRLDNFKGFATDAWMSKLYKRLKASEIVLIEELLISTAHLSCHDFESFYNNLYLDVVDRPKNWKIITEILLCTNLHM